jgi:serine phosphatase RsbU (regulator of sigma subunit)
VILGSPGADPEWAEMVAELAPVVLAAQPIGVLIVDALTVVHFANPAALQLLGVEPGRLIGEDFGLPLVPDAATDVNVPGEGDAVRTLAMRVTDLPGRELRLVTLADISGRARVYEHEHRLVETLQRSLLIERLPEPPGVRLAARYLPGEGDVQVGGDWYDVIELGDDRLGLVIGDVAGHGIGSAALMSQLRNALRAYALEHDSPRDVVYRLDGLISHLEPRGMATMVYLIYEIGTRTLRHSAAGHPYPLVLAGDGTSSYLRGGRALPLGARQGRAPAVQTVTLSEGSTLVLYTDGLIERRGRSLDEGFARLADVVGSAGGGPEQICDAILDGLVEEGRPGDDVALLVMCS